MIQFAPSGRPDITEQRWIVITSVQEPTDAVRAFASLSDWRVVVVGDRKTPSGWTLPDAEFLSPSDQTTMFPELATTIPWNSYARKNIGYLWAAKQGAILIAESDDDNSPLEQWGKGLLPGIHSLSTLKSELVANIFPYFGDGSAWPRGYPLERIRTTTPVIVDPEATTRVAVVEGLVHGDPDVDAVFRLTRNHNPSFVDKEPIAIAKGTYSPLNSQNTIWDSGSLPLMYLPSFVPFRVTDILRGWIAQRCLWETGDSIAFEATTVNSIRNVHDLMSDFRDEIDVYIHTTDILRALTKLELSGTPSTDMRTCYRELITQGWVKEREIEVLDLWLQETETMPTS